MASITLMQFIIDQSILSVGNTVRDHIENPGGGENLVVKDLEGTAISPIDLQGTIVPLEIIGIVIEDNDVIGIMDENKPEGIVEDVDIGGTVNEC